MDHMGTAYEDMERIELARECGTLWTLDRSNLPLSYLKGREFLISCATVSFSRRAQLHGVSQP
jgi:hypothetical protein